MLVSMLYLVLHFMRIVVPSDSLKEEIVLSEAWAEYGPIMGLDTRLIASAVLLDSVGSGRSISVIRARVSVSHSHSYVLVVTSDSIFRAGGFQSPELFGIANAYLQGDSAPINILGEARLLASIAESEGPNSVILPFALSQSAEQKAVAVAWLEQRPRDWIEDSVIQRDDGFTGVVVSILVPDPSRWNPGEVARWIPKQYTFLFDRRGALKSWRYSTGAVVACVSCR